MHFTPFPLGVRLYFAAIAATAALGGMMLADLYPRDPQQGLSAGRKAVWVAAVFLSLVVFFYFPGNPFAK